MTRDTIPCPPPVELPDLGELEAELREAAGASTEELTPEEALTVALSLVGVGLEVARKAGISAQAIGGHVLRLLAAYPCPCAACEGKGGR